MDEKKTPSAFPADMSDVFEALMRIASGDPHVHLDHDEGDDLGSRLRRAVNETARNLSEIVEMSHDFAIGLAENFDVLQRVSSGDLTARIRGSGRQEILEYLRELTNGTIDRLAGEIEAHRAAQKELARLATAVEQSAEGMVITDARGLCEYVNPAFVKMTGYTRSEAVGAPLRLLESSDKERGALYADMWSILKRGNVWRGQMVNRRKDGRPYEEDCTVSPIRDESGRIAQYVIIKRDVSRDLETKRRLEQSQKLEALGTMAGGIAHELNNILTPVLGFAELSLDEPNLPASTRRNLQHILGAAERAREIIWQILAFSRGEEKKEAEVLRLDRALGESMELLRAAIPTAIDLTLQTECFSPPLLLAGSTQVQQIVMNLAINATDAIRGGPGTIRVLLRDAPPEAVPAELRLDTRFAELSVSDTGCGMSPEEIGRIFEPFYTTKDVGEGTGLGLAVVHGIVTDLGGYIRVESEPGRGSTFRVFLPLLTADAVAASFRGEESALEEGREHILLVDDEIPVAEVFSRQLEMMGYKVDVFTRPEEALSAFLKDPSAFDLVLTDNAMPGITGLLLASEIRAKRRDLPILICTGFGGTIPPEQVRDLDIAQVLTKPISREELSKAVRAALDGE